MWTRKLLKENGKIAFKRNYWLCVAVSAIAFFMMGGSISLNVGNLNTGANPSMNTTQEVDPAFGGIDAWNEVLKQIPAGVWAVLILAALIGFALGFCIVILVSNVAQIGCNRYFIENREHKTNIGQVFYGFQGGRYTSVVWVMFLKGLYIFLWSMLLWIPGIIKSYSYMMVPYILAENSRLDKHRVFELSRKMMKGHKWEAFVLGLSFLGWNLLGAFTGGMLSIFYVNPYQHATYAEFYSALKAEAIQKGIATTADFPGVIVPEVEIPFV